MKKNYLLFLATSIITVFTATSCKKDMADSAGSAEKTSSQNTAEKATKFNKKEDASKTVTNSVMIPFDQIIFIASATGGENVHFTGKLHLVTKLIPPNPIIPPSPIRLHTNAAGLKGIGEQTGLIYHVVGSSESEQPFSEGNGLQFVHSYRLIPPNPIIPPSPIIPPNPILPIAYSVQFDSNGEITQATASVSQWN